MYVDAHCHLSTRDELNNESHWEEANWDNATARCVMSTNAFDWKKLKKIGQHGNLHRSFGIHPWYCHLFCVGEGAVEKRSHYQSVLEYKDQEGGFEAILEALPEPIPLEKYIEEEFDGSLVDVVGEVGLDKLFRLPENGYYVQSENRARLSRVKVKMSHQITVFKRFCRLAVETGKPISIHDVKCHGTLFDICLAEIKPDNRVKICLHSYTGSLQTLKGCWLRHYPEYQIFVSLSKYITFKSEESGRELVEFVPKSCILTETDFPIDVESPSQLTEQLKYVCSQITQVLRLVNEEECQKLIYNNYQRFLE